MGKSVLGIDFGTDSVRTLLVDSETGREIAGAAVDYPRWKKGLYCRPEKNQFRQHPLDYIESMEKAIRETLDRAKGGGRTAGSRASSPAGLNVAGIGMDTTGSTPCLVNRAGVPLSLEDDLADNPNAMFALWKDHTAVREAEEINRLAKNWGGNDFTRYEGGIYSSEWFWAKLLHILREDRMLGDRAFSFVEHCDWQTALLGNSTDPLTLKRSRCAAGHKAMWHRDWRGLPDESFLTGLDPALKGWRERLFTETHTSDEVSCRLSAEWAKKLGIPAGIPVAVGAFDAHIGAVGGGISPGSMLKIMGTSTCDMIVAGRNELNDRCVSGICGQVDGSIIPGLIGLEAGQSAFGDVFAWFAALLSWPLDSSDSRIFSDELREEIGDIRRGLLDSLNTEADKIPPGDTGLLALDWLNGRRTPDADQTLKGAVIGLTLGSSAPKIYRALVEATAFGSRATMERFQKEGVAIEEVIAVGGISQKAPFVMQVTANVMNTPIKVAGSEQTCALGAAMFGAVAAGLFPNVKEAQKTMGCGFSRTYEPDPSNAGLYDGLYGEYLKLGSSLENQLRRL